MQIRGRPTPGADPSRRKNAPALVNVASGVATFEARDKDDHGSPAAGHSFLFNRKLERGVASTSTANANLSPLFGVHVDQHAAFQLQLAVAQRLSPSEAGLFILRCILAVSATVPLLMDASGAEGLVCALCIHSSDSLGLESWRVLL